jgi:hypothetical protein
MLLFVLSLPCQGLAAGVADKEAGLMPDVRAGGGGDARDGHAVTENRIAIITITGSN